MRTIAAVVLVLALPSAAQAGFTSHPLPSSVSRSGPIGRPGDGPIVRAPGPNRRDRERAPDLSQLSRTGGHVYRELDRARDDIERRRDRGELSRSDAKELRREVRRIEEMSTRYGRDGLSDFERRELELRASELRNRTATGRTT